MFTRSKIKIDSSYLSTVFIFDLYLRDHRDVCFSFHSLFSVAHHLFLISANGHLLSASVNDSFLPLTIHLSRRLCFRFHMDLYACARLRNMRYTLDQMTRFNKPTQSRQK